MRPLALMLLVLLLRCPARAQEFPNGFSLPVELGQGFNQPAGGAPLYLLMLQAVPQITPVPGHLRLGRCWAAFIRPGGLTFDPPAMQQMLQKGIDRAKAVFEALPQPLSSPL